MKVFAILALLSTSVSYAGDQLYVLQSQQFDAKTGAQIGKSVIEDDTRLTADKCQAALYDIGAAPVTDGKYVLYRCLPIERIGETST